ncbi:MAG TPA: SMP-30/gluconolactonase/LRE family protein [Anaerolineae bacterium]|nr:SMP-30/gluconolactonase/LRE family protein [Anaerolineae bacterium]MCB9103617.1 SMP-30/gluconolactonase/LRE family protein [Anaerolineales bacterium]HRV92387.1 SMP-30/gluconolactonase/LRE family protein [Anaerolineae bacterium]
MSHIEHLLPVQNEIGESPIWVPEEQALYWADIENSHIYRYEPATGEQHCWSVELPVTALGVRASGGWITATKRGLAFWHQGQATGQFIIDPVADLPDVRFNDAVVDRQGRLWAGTMNEAELESPDGALYRFDSDGSLHLMDTGFAVTNGITWSPEGTTLYVTDMFHRVVRAYDQDPKTGRIEHCRVFVQVPEGSGLPDGLTVDSEGFVWIAFWDGWRVGRYDPNGRLEREIKLPVANVTRCTFGGANLDELYINTAWYGLDTDQRCSQPWAGDLFRAKLDITGLPEEKFVG